MAFTGQKLTFSGAPDELVPVVSPTVGDPVSVATFIAGSQVMSGTSSGLAVTAIGPSKSVGTAVTNAMSPYTVLPADVRLQCSTGGGAISIVLPTAASSSDRIIQVVDASGSAATNNITVTVSGGGSINGSASYVINSAYGNATFVCVGGAWIATATGSGGGGGGGGGYATGVRQVTYATVSTQSSGSGNIPFDNTIPQNTEGWEVMTCSITPQSATSTLYITGVVNCSSSYAGQSSVAMAIFRDSTANAIGGTYTICPIQYGLILLTAQVKITSGSTAATTFKMRIGGNVGTTYTNGQQLVGQVFGSAAATSLMVMEVGA